jgi:hypothetical protein
MRWFVSGDRAGDEPMFLTRFSLGFSHESGSS